VGQFRSHLASSAIGLEDAMAEGGVVCSFVPYQVAWPISVVKLRDFFGRRVGAFGGGWESLAEARRRRAVIPVGGCSHPPFLDRCKEGLPLSNLLLQARSAISICNSLRTGRGGCGSTHPTYWRGARGAGSTLARICSILLGGLAWGKLESSLLIPAGSEILLFL